MKQKRYKLSIENPCNEDWNSMTPDERGRFCSRCSKSVVDFSVMTDKQVINTIEKSSGQICGNLTLAQTERFFTKNQPRAFVWMYKAVATIFFLITNQQANATNPRTKMSVATVLNLINRDTVPTINQSPVQLGQRIFDSTKSVIYGHVYEEETNEPVVDALIEIKRYRLQTRTLQDGSFRLNIKDVSEYDTLVVTLTAPNTTIQGRILTATQLPLKTNFYTQRTNGFEVRGKMRVETNCIIEEKSWWEFWK